FRTSLGRQLLGRHDCLHTGMGCECQHIVGLGSSQVLRQIIAHSGVLSLARGNAQQHRGGSEQRPVTHVSSSGRPSTIFQPAYSTPGANQGSIPMIRNLAKIAALAGLAGLAGPGCSSGSAPGVTAIQRIAAERAIRTEVEAAYDFTRPDVPGNLMALYAPTGPILSASGGRITTSRDSLRAGIQAFWTNVGQNMRDAHVEWTAMHIDVLAP